MMSCKVVASVLLALAGRLLALVLRRLLRLLSRLDCGALDIGFIRG